MLNNKNLFLSVLLASNFALISSLYADNPGEVVAQADEVAEEVVTEVISLPVHPGLSLDDVKEVAETVNRWSNMISS